MADRSPIEWTDATWNPITGCTLVSEGCRHCYAARLAATRLQHHPSRKGLARINAAGEAKFTGEVRFNPQALDQPLRWRRPRMIFVCAHGDLFHESVPDEWIDQVFAVMALAPQHTFQVLTKRPERMRKYMTAALPNDAFERVYHLMAEMVAGGVPTVRDTCERYGLPWMQPDSRQDWWPLSNVWLGTSIEDQPTADTRIPYLLQTPAAVRWISAEPLLGPVDLGPFGLAVHHHPDNVDSPQLQAIVRAARRALADGKTIDWVVAGGESGPGARPMHPEWVRSLRDQCATAGVPFLFKQWGAWGEPRIGEPYDTGKGRLASPPAFIISARDGTVHCFENPAIVRGVVMVERGKKAAGRVLDGVQHDGFPSRATRPGASA